MAPPLRIAILECDTPLEGTRAKYGSYGGVFRSLLLSAASSLSAPPHPPPPPPPLSTSAANNNNNNNNNNHNDKKSETPPPLELDLTTYDVVTKQTYPDLSTIDAILLTGSRYSAFDNEPWILALVKHVQAALSHPHVRVLGICFGHQIVGRALGAKVARSPLGWEASVLPFRLSSLGREIFDGRSHLSLHQMHRDIVVEYPPGVEPLGESERCATQGMLLRPRMNSHSRRGSSREGGGDGDGDGDGDGGGGGGGGVASTVPIGSVGDTKSSAAPAPATAPATTPATATKEGAAADTNNTKIKTKTTDAKTPDHDDDNGGGGDENGVKTSGCITVQGHPEFNEGIVRELLESRHAQGIFDDATFEDAMRRVGLEHDGVVVARGFLRFLLDD